MAVKIQSFIISMFRVLLPLTSSLPTLSNPNISFLGTEEMQTKTCRAYSVGTQEASHEDSERKAYPVSVTRSPAQGLQWRHKIRMERTLLQLGKKDVRYNTVTLQKILDTKGKV